MHMYRLSKDLQYYGNYFRKHHLDSISLMKLVMKISLWG